MSALSARFPRLPSRQTLRHWLAGETSPTTSMNEFEPRPSEELSFFLGAWLGDGWADESDGGKRLLLKVRSREFAEEFARSATKILNKAEPYKVREITDETGKWYLVKVTSLLLYEFVNQPFSKLTSIIEHNRVAFLRGFFTAEGNPSVSIQRSAKGHPLDVTLCVSNTTMEYILFARNQVSILGYHPTRITIGYKAGQSHPIQGVQYTAKETEWQFRIASLVEIKRFLAQIGFADRVKQEKAFTAAELIERHGGQRASSFWTQIYTKKSRKWVKMVVEGSSPLQYDDGATLH